MPNFLKTNPYFLNALYSHSVNVCVYACRHVPREHQRDLAFILNSLLRLDDASATPYLAVIVRAINALIVARQHNVETLQFPPNGIVYRGGGLPDQHRVFFQPGKKYRVPGFLATSFLRQVAGRFMTWANGRGEPCVLWIVHVDPEGEHSEEKRCVHVNYVTRTNVEGEDEYLFAPYAPFAVREVRGLRVFYADLSASACVCMRICARDTHIA